MRQTSQILIPSKTTDTVFILKFGILFLKDFFGIGFDFFKYCIKIIFILITLAFLCLTCLTLVPALNSFQDQGSGKCRSPQLRIGALGPQLFPHQRWWWIGMFPGEKGNLSLRQTQASCLISKHQELYFEWTATSMSSPANLLHLLHSFLLSVFSWPEMGPVSHLQLHSSLNQLSARTFFGWGSLRWDISQDPNTIVYTLGSPQGLGRRGRISRQDRPPNCQIFIFGGMSGNIYLCQWSLPPFFADDWSPVHVWDWLVITQQTLPFFL